jgi:hypothetical protein
MTWRAAISLIALAAAGCTWGGGPSALRLTQVIPEGSTRGVTRIVTVRGEGFSPSVVVDFDDPASSRVCASLRVELRAAGQPPIPLERARFVSSTELRAHLGGEAYASAFRAQWDVVVIGPEGMEATLPQAFRIDGCDTAAQPCDDGEPDCTSIDVCTGAARCGGTAVADATPCAFECTDGTAFPGSCQQGACVPVAGLCDSPPACTAP